MSVLLLVAGAILVMFGVGMVGYGIPINEFSFGNTLIVAGTTATVGGLIVIAIGAAVAQLRRISEALVAHPPARAGRPLETFEPPAEAPVAPAPGRFQFPPKPKSDVGIREPVAPDVRMPPPPAEMPYAERAAVPGAPALPNPELPPLEEYRDVLASPQYPAAVHPPGRAGRGEAARPAPPPGINGSSAPERRLDAPLDAAWNAPPPPPARRQAQPLPNNFDAMWPAESKPATWPAEPKPARSPAASEAAPEPKPDLPPPNEDAIAPEPPMSRQASEPPRGAAILKSGVVDGMAYTLYVDGSIEAELPQGTLRFASINELRSHLSKGA
jgi:hypothetical protein